MTRSGLIYLFLVLMTQRAHGQMFSRSLKQQQCKYEFVVPSSNGCSAVDQELKDSIAYMKMELNRERLNQVTLNSAVQDQVSHMKTELNRLGGGLDSLKTRLSTLQPVTAGELIQLRKDNFAVNTLLLNIRDDILDKLEDLKSSLDTINSTVTDEVDSMLKLKTQVKDQNQYLGQIGARLFTLEQQSLTTTKPTTLTSASAASTSFTKRTTY